MTHEQALALPEGQTIILRLPDNGVYANLGGIIVLKTGDIGTIEGSIKVPFMLGGQEQVLVKRVVVFGYPNGLRLALSAAEIAQCFYCVDIKGNEIPAPAVAKETVH